MNLNLKKPGSKKVSNDLHKRQFLSVLHPEWFHVISSLLANNCKGYFDPNSINWYDSPDSAEGLSILSAGTRGPLMLRWFQGFLSDLGLRKKRRRLCGGVGQPGNNAAHIRHSQPYFVPYTLPRRAQTADNDTLMSMSVCL
jgi:hypothetical protein